MRREPDRLNSAVLTLLAVALVAVGAYGLARGAGAFGDARANDPVLTDDVRHFVSRNAGWFWPVAAVACLLLAWLGLRWLVAQLSSPAVHRLDVPAAGPGRTELSASAAAAALARDVAGYAGVRGARARVVADHPRPELEVTVEVADDADVPAIRRRIDDHALDRLRTALEVPDVRASVHVRLAEPAGRTVR